jgi:hypothetical protein
MIFTSHHFYLGFGIWTHGLTLARQVVYHWGHTSAITFLLLLLLFLEEIQCSILKSFEVQTEKEHRYEGLIYCFYSKQILGTFSFHTTFLSSSPHAILPAPGGWACHHSCCKKTRRMSFNQVFAQEHI